MGKLTQRDQVLLILQEAGERGVHSFEFLQGYLPRVAARVNELRNMGHTITSTREKFQGKAAGVRYTLVEQGQMELAA